MNIDTINIIGHIVGISTYNHNNFLNLWNRSSISKKCIIIDLNKITEKIINDEKMNLLYIKYEDLLLKYNKTNIKVKDIEKKMNDYWKVKMEYYLIKYINKTNKLILLIGYLSYFKNHKININLNINTKYFIDIDINDNIKKIIEYNLDNNKNDIINSQFDLNYLNKEFLEKSRLNIISIYKKLHYNLMSVNNIIKSIELNYYNDKPNILYFCSDILFNKKIINNNDNFITAYTEDWISLVSPKIENINLNIIKGINNKIKYVKLSNDNIKLLKNKYFLYEITNTSNFIPFPSKNNIYKYIICNTVNFNRIIEIDNIIDTLNKLNINMVKI